MPSGAKDNKFFNRHAEEARAREAEQTAAKRAQAKQQAEEAEWEDDDKLGARKAARAAEKEQKAQEALQRRQERLAEEAAEDKELSKKPPKAVSKREQQRLMASLVRNYDMEAKLNSQSSDSGDLATRHSKAKNDGVVYDETPLVDGNPNRAPPQARAEPDEIRASGIDASVKALEDALKKTKVEDRHIGKRARAAYRQFEAANLEALKQSKPGMRRTQYNDLLWALWQKSPENPFVQRAVQRADEMLQRKWCQDDEEPSDDEGMDE
jgi:hypothetical protein